MQIDSETYFFSYSYLSYRFKARRWSSTFVKILNQREKEASERLSVGSLGIMDDFGCPLCRLFTTEVGILNAPEKELAIFSLHLREAHGYFYGGE